MLEQQYIQSVLYNASLEIYLQMYFVYCIYIIQGDFEKVLFFDSLRDRKKSTKKDFKPQSSLNTKKHGIFFY